MGIDTQHDFDLDGESLFDLLNDPEYLEAKWSKMGHQDINVETKNDGTVFKITSERNVPANVPNFAATLLSNRNDIVQKDTWTWLGDGNAEGTWEVNVKGSPVKLSGTMEISQHTDNGCSYVIRGNAKVSIPFVGNKIANFVRDDTRKSIDEDLAFTLEYIKDSL